MTDELKAPETVREILNWSQGRGKNWDSFHRNSYERGYGACANSVAGRLEAALEIQQAEAVRVRRLVQSWLNDDSGLDVVVDLLNDEVLPFLRTLAQGAK
jgi:hypothetical protein